MSRRVDLIAAAVLAAARAEGCTCEPDVTLGDTAGRLARAQLAHDDWCGLLRAHENTDGTPPRTIAIVPPSRDAS